MASGLGRIGLVVAPEQLRLSPASLVGPVFGEAARTPLTGRESARDGGHVVCRLQLTTAPRLAMAEPEPR